MYARILQIADSTLCPGGTLVSIIEVPGRLLIFGFLSRPWSLIVNLVADPRVRRFDSRWPQTLMRCTACVALSDRQIDLAIAGARSI